MTQEDLDQVLAIEQVSFVPPWTRGLFADSLEQADSYFFVGEIQPARCSAATTEGGGTIAAYGGGSFVVDEFHLLSLAVHPARQRERIGARALLHVLETAARRGARRMTLEVRANNVGALSLYERFGFVAVALRKNYYAQEGVDAVIMWINDLDTPAQRECLRQWREALGPS